MVMKGRNHVKRKQKRISCLCFQMVAESGQKTVKYNFTIMEKLHGRLQQTFFVLPNSRLGFLGLGGGDQKLGAPVLLHVSIAAAAVHRRRKR
jgi:hypothetical protein